MTNGSRLSAAYWQVLEGQRRKAILLVCLFVLSGLLEGLALTAVIPLLGIGAPEEASGLIGKWLGSLQLSDAELARGALVAFVILGLLSAVVKFLAVSGAVRLRTSLEASMRTRMTRVLASMDWSTFLTSRLGDISQSVMLEGAHTATGVFAAVQGTALGLIAAMFVFLGLLVSPHLTALTLLFGLFGAMAYRYAGKKAEEKTRTQAEEAAVIGGHISEIFGNLKFFRSTGTTAESTNKAEDAYERYGQASFMGQFYGALVHFIFESVSFGFVGFILAVSLITHDRLTSSALVFLAIFYRLAPRLQTAQTNFQQARALRPWLDAWAKRMQWAQDHPDRPRGRRSPSLTRGIEFKDVVFAFPGSEVNVLEAVTWSIEKGRCVALVGESGSGKTTTLDLLTGLLRPTRGRVLVDGRSLEDIDRAAWQRRIGLVMQDSPLFHSSVLENIALGDPDPDVARAARCAEAANALDFISSMPEGFASIVGEKGGRLSGGQRQRIALARALYREPWLLVLDEATSALDAASESVVQEALEKIKGMCSIVIVAHRLKTVQMADRIHVLKHGRLEETGSWDELLARRGEFAELAIRQGILRAGK